MIKIRVGEDVIYESDEPAYHTQFMHVKVDSVTKGRLDIVKVDIPVVRDVEIDLSFGQRAPTDLEMLEEIKRYEAMDEEGRKSRMAGRSERIKEEGIGETGTGNEEEKEKEEEKDKNEEEPKEIPEFNL